MSDRSSSDPVTLPVHCAYCQGKVTLQMSDWALVVDHDATLVSDRHPAPERAEWTCPHCATVNEGGFPGRLIWAIKGHTESGSH